MPTETPAVGTATLKATPLYPRRDATQAQAPVQSVAKSTPPVAAPNQNNSDDRRTEHLRILVVEDNPTLCEAISHGLREQGWIVESVMKGYDAEEMAATGEFDLIVLDLMLPDRDGLDVCKGLRRREVKTPILILSAISSTKDRVRGLDFGADDFLPKPFEYEELIARIRAILRRGQAGESAVLRVADLELDLYRRQAKRGEATISLTAKEFALLEFFMRKSDRAVTRAQIGASVWDLNFDPSSNVIDVYVSALRRKIDKGFETPLIHTLIGTGYMFSATKP